MDNQRFDRFVRAIAILGTTRRSLVPGIGGVGIAAMLGQVETAAARCVAPGKRCKTKQGKKKCCGGAKCQGTKCKCPAGQATCVARCCARGQRCQNRKCVANPPIPTCVCATGCPYTNVAAAVAAARPGNVIRLCAGTHASQGVSINKAGALTLLGEGAGSSVLDGGGTNRVLTINAGNITLKDLTVTGGGGTDGAGILNRGTLTLRGVTVTGNTTPDGSGGDGGGLHNDGGNLHVIDSLVTLNKAVQAGGGIYNNDGNVTLTNSTVIDNSANIHGGGIGNAGANATLTLNGSTVEDNLSADGGGIYNILGEVTLTDASKVRLNNAQAESGGGGILNAGRLILNNSSVTENGASIGGGISSIGTITLDDSTVADNTAGQGGGIYILSGTLISQNGTIITGNEALDPPGGGGIHVVGQDATITVEPNSVTGNTPQNCFPTGSITNCVDA